MNKVSASIGSASQVAKEEDLDCGLKQLDGYVFTYAGQDAETKVQKELSAVKDATLTEAKLVSSFSALQTMLGIEPHINDSLPLLPKLLMQIQQTCIYAVQRQMATPGIELELQCRPYRLY